MKTRYFILALGVIAVLNILGCGSKNSPSNPSSNSSSSSPVNYSFQTFFGNAGAVTLGEPLEIGMSGGTLWVANFTLSNAEAWTLDGSPSDVVSVFGSPVTDIANPIGLNTGSDGYVYVATQGANEIVEFSPTGQYVTVFGAAQLTGIPTGVAVNANYAYAIVGSTPATVYYYSVSGTGSSKTFTYKSFFGNSSSVTLGQGNNGGLRLDSSGNLYLADAHKGRVVKYNSTGTYMSAVTATGLVEPIDEVFDPAGNMYVSDYSSHNIQVFNSSGQPVTEFGDSILTAPFGLAMDANQNLYVSDLGTNSVVVFQNN